MCSRLMLHMVKVEALAFSPNAKYLVSLGGADDGRLETVRNYWLGVVISVLEEDSLNY